MTKRLEYFDCLRGMVMLMVVFCHTCGDFCLGLKENFWVSHLLGVLMLPGFFLSVAGLSILAFRVANSEAL